MTFGDMIDRVGELINQSVADDTLTVTRTQVKANLNRGYHKTRSKVIKLGQGYFEVESKTDLVANQEMYALPSDCHKLIRVDVSYDSAITITNPGYRAHRIDTQHISNADFIVSETEPLYRLAGDQIELIPTPTANQTDGIQIRYIPSASDMTNDADVPDLPVDTHDLLIEYAVGKAKQSLGLINEGSVAIGEFYNELQRLEDILGDRASDGPDNIVLVDEF